MRLAAWLAGLALSAAGPALAVAQGPSLSIEFGTERAVLRLADLEGMPVDSARVKIHQSPERLYQGVSVVRILRQIGFPIDSLRGPRLAQYLLVEAADGYRAVFSLAEIAPELAARPVLVAFRVDGQPLPSSDGPFRLIVAGESRPTRWVRQVTRLRILAAPPVQR